MTTSYKSLKCLTVWLLLATPVVFTAVQSRPAAASMMVPLDTGDLVARADRIFVGTVEKQSARWTGDDHRLIVTEVSIRVTQPVRGVQTGDLVTLVTLGGTVGGVGMRTFGEAAYTTGEEVLQFAERRGAYSYSVGMAQGKLHISRSQAGRRMVEGGLSGAELLPGKTSQAARGPRPLEDFLRDVTAAMQQHPGPGGAR